MKLHRLVLTNYRGITHREIEFPDRGVVVVSGANEIGKSSMIEALDLLLEAKDRSGKKEVKQVKPTHADVGAEITAEISTGPYRFEYRKRFHKRCETALTILAPHREQLTGDEAHDRVRAILDETVDTGLWQAHRVLQSTSTAAVDLSGCDALSRALDVAAGEAASDVTPGATGAEALLIDRIEAEYLRYFTRTGRPTGEWAAVTNRLRDAEEDLARCAAAVAEVDDAVRRHGELTESLGRLVVERVEASQRLTAAQQAADTVAELTRQLKEAELVAAAADAAHQAAVAAVIERRRLRADIEERAAAIAELQAAVTEAADEQDTAAEVAQAAETAAEEARTAVETTRARVEAARHLVQQLADREEAQRLTTRLTKIDAAQGELERIDTELADITLTDELMRAIEAADVAVERAAGQAELMSARVELTAVADVEVRVDGEPVGLQAGATWSSNLGAPTDIELPGVIAARVVPGATATETRAKLVVAQQVLAEALAQAGVDDIATARLRHQQRRELTAERDRLCATVEALTGEDTLDALRSRLTELGEATGIDADGPGGPAQARAELDAASDAYRQAVADCELHRKVAEEAAKRLGERTERVAALRAKLTAVEAEIGAVRTRLADQRATVSDDELAVNAETHGDKARRAAELVAELGTELAGTAPETVATTLHDAAQRAEELGTRHDELAEALREVSTQLRVYGTQGRKSQLDDAETEREHAQTEYARVRRRARAAELLRSVITRHRDATRLRYVEPFRTEVERLGRIVFGETFEVEIDSALRICSRTLAGRTVPYDSLSGGAKEQLGIVARLASAALVAKEDTVPVVIDDALGFTDADRLAKMGAVFNAVGGDGQVIVLTCHAQRYAGIDGAQHIELAASA
ncbi:AAA family ATPase [Mycolicibacterium pulveris]|uniref:AAA family ATPase n=1 Tax=Mycolicibacterium pulveris TaxID=36813 RepID=UPI003CFB810A